MEFTKRRRGITLAEKGHRRKNRRARPILRGVLRKEGRGREINLRGR